MASKNPYAGVDTDIAKLIAKRKKTGEDIGRLTLFNFREEAASVEQDELERLYSLSDIIIKSYSTLKDGTEDMVAFRALNTLRNTLDRMTDRRKIYEQQFYHGIYRMYRYLDNALDYMDALDDIVMKNPLFVTGEIYTALEKDMSDEGIAKVLPVDSTAYHKVILGGKVVKLSNDEDAKTYGNGKYIEPEKSVLLVYQRWNLKNLYKEEKYTIYGLRNKIILPALRYIYSYYAFLTIIEQVYKIKDLALYTGSPMEDIDEYMRRYRNLTDMLTSSTFNHREFTKISKELFPPIEPRDYQPSKKVVRNIKRTIVDMKGTVKEQPYYFYRSINSLITGMYMRDY